MLKVDFPAIVIISMGLIIPCIYIGNACLYMKKCKEVEFLGH